MNGPAVFGYVRVSQAEGESGLATQRRALADHGLRDDRIYTDVASGQEYAPAGVEHAAGDAPARRRRRGPAIDRLALSLGDGLRAIEELHSEGIHIRAVRENLDTGDDSPTSKLMLHMLLSLAEWERESIRGADPGRRRPCRGRRAHRRAAPGARL